MAKTFDPSTLPPSDQAAFSQWQQQLQQYVAQNGGAIPAPVSYALAHPDYLQSHPELRDAYNIVSGATLPASTLDKLKDYHPNWSGGSAGFDKNSGLWNKWESWLQLGLGAAVAAPAIAGALGAAQVAGAAGGSTAATGGTAAAAFWQLGGGYGAATTSAAIPASLAANVGAATAAGHGIFSSLVAPALIKGAGAVVDGVLAHNAANKATDQLTAASDKAQAINQQVYDKIQSQYAPFISDGTGAFSQLTQGLGLPAYQAPAQAASAPQGQPQTMAPQAAPQQAPPMVQLRSPTGQVRAVPQDQVQHYVQLGASPV